MDAKLQLARQASSGESPIVKGSADGSGMSYQIRSCFLFSSIGQHVSSSADESRITTLILNRGNDSHRQTVRKQLFADVQRMAMELDTQYYIRLRTTIVSRLPIILKNARTLLTVSIEYTKSQRASDQIGTLLACSLALECNRILTAEDADDWCKKLDWSEAEEHTENDEDRCFNHILSSVVRIDNTDHTIYSMIDDYARCLNSEGYDEIEIHKKRENLSRFGIRYFPVEAWNVGEVRIANTNQHMRKILSGTPWEVNWKRALENITGSKKHTPAIFCGTSSRSVGVPYTCRTEFKEVF
jgi:putative DNA primase/helicase